MQFRSLLIAGLMLCGCSDRTAFDEIDDGTGSGYFGESESGESGDLPLPRRSPPGSKSPSPAPPDHCPECVPVWPHSVALQSHPATLVPLHPSLQPVHLDEAETLRGLGFVTGRAGDPWSMALYDDAGDRLVVVGGQTTSVGDVAKWVYPIDLDPGTYWVGIEGWDEVAYQSVLVGRASDPSGAPLPVRACGEPAWPATCPGSASSVGQGWNVFLLVE